LTVIRGARVRHCQTWSKHGHSRLLPRTSESGAAILSRAAFNNLPSSVILGDSTLLGSPVLPKAVNISSVSLKDVDSDEANQQLTREASMAEDEQLQGTQNTAKKLKRQRRRMRCQARKREARAQAAAIATTGNEEVVVIRSGRE
jgi:hypothetical protein